VAEKEQLAALASLDELLAREKLEYWVFGGWAVDLHAGEITRPHDALDIAVSASEHGPVRRVLAAAGWTPVEQGPGYVAYARDGIRDGRGKRPRRRRDPLPPSPLTRRKPLVAWACPAVLSGELAVP
jgi:hypothetical protein